MMTNGMRRLAAAAAVAATVAAGLMAAAPAHADTISASTTCSNPYTGSQAGPSSFDVEIPAAAVVGDQVDVTVSFAFTNGWSGHCSCRSGSCCRRCFGFRGFMRRPTSW